MRLYGDHRRHAFGADPFVDAGKFTTLQKLIIQTGDQQIDTIEDDIGGAGFGLVRGQAGKQAGQIESTASNGVDGKPGIDQGKLLLRHCIERPVQPREVASHSIDRLLESHVKTRLARRPPPVEQILHGEQAFSGARSANDGRQPVFRQTSVRDLIKAGDAGRLLADFARMDARTNFRRFRHASGGLSHHRRAPRLASTGFLFVCRADRQHALVLDHPGKVFRRERQAEEITLTDRATLLAQDIALLGGLDSLGDQSKLEAVGQRCDGMDDRGVARVLHQLTHENSIVHLSFDIAPAGTEEGIDDA